MKKLRNWSASLIRLVQWGILSVRDSSMVQLIGTQWRASTAPTAAVPSTFKRPSTFWPCDHRSSTRDLRISTRDLCSATLSSGSTRPWKAWFWMCVSWTPNSQREQSVNMLSVPSKICSQVCFVTWSWCQQAGSVSLLSYSEPSFVLRKVTANFSSKCSPS